jgi:pSer/pThr/pTyr-binding forkhead associated (FHA) protein
VDLTDTISVAGRAPENRIVIDDKQSSRRHFQIEKVDIGFKLVDLESRNGTRVNDRSVNQALLRPGDKIQIGKHVLTFEDPSFKEPPADVAARLGPPPAARVELPSSGPDGATLPVAQEVVKPTASLPQAPPPQAPPQPYDGQLLRLSEILGWAGSRGSCMVPPIVVRTREGSGPRARGSPADRGSSAHIQFARAQSPVAPGPAPPCDVVRRPLSFPTPHFPRSCATIVWER